jgi:hypothetical protein
VTEQRKRARDVISRASALRDKIKQLNKFSRACDEAGLAEDFSNAARSTNAFAAKCLGFINTQGASDEATQSILSQHKEATSNLMALALSANSAGINLQTEARDVFDTINDLMEILGLARD